MEEEKQLHPDAEFVHVFCHTAFAEPKEGGTLWDFQTREIDRSLTPDEVIEHIEGGKGVYLVELVWDQDMELQQRGEGVVIRTFTQLHELAEKRMKYVSQLVRDPSMAAEAPADPRGLGKPEAKTSIPWHPAAMSTDKGD
jgi:hypothetical protein